MKKKVDEKKTLEHAVSFIFYNTTNVQFSIGNKIHEYINTVYDHNFVDGANTVAVLHDYKNMKYIAVAVDREPIGNKEITIL